MLEFYEPIINLSDPENHNTMGVFLSLKDPVDGEILRHVVEELRVCFPYFYVKAVYKGDDVVTEANELPMTVRNTWQPLFFWKYGFLLNKYLLLNKPIRDLKYIFPE